MFSTIAILVYGIEQGQRGMDTLSWAYYLSLVALFFILSSLIAAGLEVKRLSRKSTDEVPILRSNSTICRSQRTLTHSMSVDSCASLRTIETPVKIAVQMNRPRSESQCRMRVNSVSYAPTVLEEDEECKGAPFYLDNEVS